MMKIVLMVLGLFVSTLLLANVTLHSLFGESAVLQRNIPMPVYGTANPGERIEVDFNKQKVTTQADEHGNWKVILKPMEAGGPYVMTVQGQNRIEVKDLYLGEVWVCGGQSNMERQLGPRSGQKLIDNWEAERDAADYPLIREYKVPVLREKEYPMTDCNGKWTVCSPQTVKNFSAVAYFFASELYKNLRVPVGLIYAAVGGTPIESWTSREMMKKNSIYTKFLEEYDVAKAKADLEMAVYEANGAVGKPPRGIPYSKYALFNGMIAPLLDFPIKGVLWYQGEANVGRWQTYTEMTKLMVEDWRNRWCVKKTPFLYVQLAPYRSNSAEMKEAQRRALEVIPYSAMVVTTDCGDPTDIHPANKRPVGERLALAARALAYGQKIVYSGPAINKVRYKDGKAILSFTFVGSGLVFKGSELKGFEIAGKDLKFCPAKAIIIGEKIEVQSPQVPMPAAVRFGWSNIPDVNLFNKEGLPAVPFTIVR